MDTLGKIFTDARTKKKVSPSEAARVTRIKVQLIEAMERDDFSAIAAPAYAKGFIRIYAEYLGLDSAPLIDEYVTKHLGQGTGQDTPLLESNAAEAPAPSARPPRPKRTSTAPEDQTYWRDNLAIPKLKMDWKKLQPSPRMLRIAGMVLGALLVLFLLSSAVRRCSKSTPDKTAIPQETPAPTVHDGALPIM